MSSGKREDSGVVESKRQTRAFRVRGTAKQGFQCEKTAKQGSPYRVIVRVLVLVSVRDFGST